MRIRRSALAICTALVASTLSVPAQAEIVDNVIEHSAANPDVKLSAIGTYDSGVLAESAAEIVAFHPESKRILTVNAKSGQIDILDASDPTKLTLIESVSAGAGKEINSVAVRADGLAVAAVQAENKTDAGEALFFNVATGEELGTLPVGSLPDNVHITADGKYALLANEGEPSNELNATGTDYAADPQGTVSIIKLDDAVALPTAPVSTVDFTEFDNTTLPASVRVFGPEAHDSKASIDFEPEYITSANGKAFVTLQEANAIAIIDIESATVDKLVPALVQDHMKIALDSSNKDDAAELRTIPVQGLSMPDSIGAFTAGGSTYFATANEGDAREWGVKVKDGGTGVYTDETTIEDLAAGGKLCDNFDADLADKKVAGKLKVSAVDGFNTDKGCYDELYSYGSRSFTIYDEAGNVVFDSGSQFEEITAELHKQGTLNFNADNEGPDFDDRSDNKGPEPEALTIGKIGERTFAFIGAERVGGIFVYDITDPKNAEFETYINNRDFSVAFDDANPSATLAAGDLGPEGFAFVDKKDSPNGEYLLIVGNEVSGTTTVYQIDSLMPEPAAPGNTSSDMSSGSSDAKDGEDDANKDKGSSTGGIIAAVIVGALAAALGAAAMIPGLGDQILAALPLELRKQVESFM